MNRIRSHNAQAVLCGVLTVALALGWQYLTVEQNYGGNWSALFMTGSRFGSPDQLSEEQIYEFQASYGYDGQFYHYVAHDPLMTTGLTAAADDPVLRWRRILVPGLAWLVALGEDSWIDTAYRGVVLFFMFVGTYWMSLLASRFGCNAVWGLLFLATPAAAISVERLTVDIALTALSVGYVYYSLQGRRGASWLVLALCPLARETGLAIIAADGLWHLLRRSWSQSLVAALAVAPFAVWYTYVSSQADAGAGGWVSWPLHGLIERSMQLFPGFVPDAKASAAAVLDYIGVVGVWLGLAQSVRLIRTDLWSNGEFHAGGVGPLELCLASFTLAAVMLGSPEVWFSVYSFARVLSPWFLFLALVAIRDGKPWLLAPAGLMLPRIAAQYGTQALGIVSSVTGF